jgi:hypothetical protein
MYIPTTALDNFNLKEEEEEEEEDKEEEEEEEDDEDEEEDDDEDFINIVMKIDFQTCLLQKCSYSLVDAGS